MHASPSAPPPHARSSAASYSPVSRPSPPPHPSPGHHPRSHHAHHASIAHLPTITAATNPTTTLHPHPPPHHHAHALSLHTLPSYLSPTFNPSHPKSSPSHKPPHPPLDSTQKDYYATAATVQQSTKPLRPWRLTSRVRTTAVALCLCLNAGIDPPDAERSQSSHQLAYTPILASPSTATATVLQRLQAQYERWQPKATYRHIGDPTPSQLEKQLRSLRRSLPSHTDRLLLHYCGYGVPRVTSGGEVWLFNREYTQYLPVGVREVLSWSGWPAVIVVEAAGGGAVVDEVGRWVAEGKRAEDERREAESKSKGTGRGAEAGNKEKEEERKEREPGDDTTPRALSILSSISSSPSPPPTSASPPPLPPPSPLYPSATDLIVLSATSAGQAPPLHPSLPADLFTCCLTTPITIALGHFSLHSPLLPPLTTHQLDGIPGTLTDRRTPLGELNWIFTSITDTIAFSSLPPRLFHQLFRQDLLVSSLFRNFLLAQRLLRQYGVVVCSWPAVPSCHKHGLWEAWDSVVETYCLQLDRYLHHKVKFTPSPFFSDQLAAFELTLDLLSASSSPPLQLPIVLQLLLSPSHRRRALLLLARFLSRSSVAVQQVLDVGIFPYVLKLLEGGGGEVREVLCYVWVKLIASDSSVADELLSGGGWRYFVEGIMAAGTGVSERQRSMCMYVLAQLVSHKVEAQSAVSSPQLCTALTGYFDSDNAALRKWALLLLAKLVHGQPIPPLSASTSSPTGAQQSPAPTLPDRVTMLCFDAQPDVRAAAVYTLSCLLDDPSNSSGMPVSSSFSSSTTSTSFTPSLSPPPSPMDDGTDGSTGSGVSGASMGHSMHMLSIFRLLCNQLAFDGSGSVTEELVVALSVLVDGQLDEFREAAREDDKERDERSDRRREASEHHNPLPPLAPLTPTATQRSPSPLVSPVHGSRRLHGLQQQSLAAVGRGSSGSPHSSSPSPSPPPTATVLTSFAGSSLALPLFRAFSEPPQSIAAVRTAPPPSLILSPSGSSSASLSSLPDNSRPPSPATTALSTLTASSSTSSLFMHDRSYLTPPRSLRLPLSFPMSLSPLQQRQHIWRCIRLLCQDALPAVATAAVSVCRRVKEGNTNKGSKHKPSPPLNPHTQPEGVLVIPSTAGTEPSPRSLNSVADSPLKIETDSEAAGGSTERRSHAITLNPLRRIASAASNMAHAASDKTHSLFSSASSASLHDSDRHPPSSSQSSPVHSASSSPQTVPAFVPSSSHLSMLSLLSTPVTSSFFKRSSDSFLLPAVDVSSVASSTGVVADSASSTLLSLMQREYRHRQNEQMYRAESALAYSSVITASPFDLLYTLPSPASSSSSPTASSDVLTSLLFHPYQPLLFATTTGRVSVFDLHRRERRYVWSNDNRASTRITGASLINPHSVSLLATSTDCGEVRVWRWPHERQPLLVNAWQGLRVGVAGASGGVSGRGRSANGGCGVGMVMEWMQAQGWMCCGGASDAISIWDVEREACIIDLPIEDSTGGMAAGGNSGLPYFASVTCLTSSASSPLLFSGGLDGTLRCFDLRVPSSSSCVTLSKQQSPLLRVQCTKAHDVIEEGNVVCASRDGEVLRVDMRYIVQRDDRDRANSLHQHGTSVGPIAQAGTVTGGGMTALTLSPAHVPLTAASSRNGSPSPSAASTAGSMSSLSSSLHPSPMMFPSHGSPISTASSPAMLPSTHSNSPTLLSSAAPFTHLTAFPSTSSTTPASPLSAFAVHPALSLYAAVSTGRSLRVFSDHSTLFSSGGGRGSRPTQSSPQRRGTGRSGKEGRGAAGGGGGGESGASESVVAWHPCVLTMAASMAGGEISVYGQATNSSVGVGAGNSGSGGSKSGDGGSANINRSSHGLFSSSFIS